MITRSDLRLVRSEFVRKIIELAEESEKEDPDYQLAEEIYKLSGGSK